LDFCLAIFADLAPVTQHVHPRCVAAATQPQGSSVNDSIKAANVVAMVPAACFAAPAAAPGLPTVGGGSVGVIAGDWVEAISGVAGVQTTGLAEGSADVVVVVVIGFVTVVGPAGVATVVLGCVVAG
jgi:hypothetical protein